MNRTSPAFDFNAALHNPAHVFGEPEAVLRQQGLDDRMKVQILEQWEHDARALMVAEDEGMAGSEAAKLGRMRHALRQLRPEAPRPRGTGTKHSG
jgi:hypothetical protein